MKELRILHLEDDPFFADMVEELLKAHEMSFRIRRADTWTAFESVLPDGPWDLILSDHNIPGGDGLKALSLCRRACPTVPFIFLSGMLGEELAIDSLKNGAADYVLKSNLSRLVPTMKRTLAAFRETTALRAAEARIRQDQANLHGLIENTTDAIWSMDMDFNILVFNSAASLLCLKLTGQPMVEGTCLLDRVPEDLQSMWREAGVRIRKGDRFVQELELEWPGGRGSHEISFHPITTGKGVTGMALFGKDVTERKRVEEAARDLEERSRRIKGLYRNMRIPVHGLTRMAGLLERTSLDEVQRRYLGMMHASVRRISELGEKSEAFAAGRPATPAELRHETPDRASAGAAGKPPAGRPRARSENPREPGEERRRNGPFPMRILVVEDNPINQVVVMGFLENLGYTADVVPDGRSAVEICGRQDYDLILMDCHMPVMDGYDASQAIRSREAGTGRAAWIVAMTADVMSGTREKCLASGMDAYMSKPFSLESLQQEMERASRRPVRDLRRP